MSLHRTAAGFKLDLAKASKAVGVGAETFVKRLGFGAFRGFVLRMPISFGTAAGNCNIAVGSVDDSTDPALTGTRQSALSRAENKGRVLLNLTLGQTIFISNHLPYVETLEFGGYPGSGPKTVGGFSKQAPLGMLRLAIAEEAARADEAAALAMAEAGL